MLTIFLFDWDVRFKIGHAVESWHVGDGGGGGGGGGGGD